MQHLPWLVVHGALAFRLALAGAALVGLTLVWLTPRARARWQARQVRETLGDPSDTAGLEEGATVTVVGALEVFGASAVRFEDGSPAAAATVAFDRGALREGGPWSTAVVARAETLAVITDGARFELTGEVEVLAGSIEVRRGLPLRRLAPAIRARAADGLQRAAPAYAARPVALRSIKKGEQVRVRGVLRREPASDESATYRDARTRWILAAERDPRGGTAHPDASLAPALSLAFEGSPRVSGPAWPLLCRGAGAGAILFVAITSLTGEIAGRVAISPGPPGRAVSAALLAAASPLHRERALATLGATLSLRCLDDYSRDHFEQEVAVAELQGDCAGAAGTLIRHGQLERAASVADRCGAPRMAARAHYLRGRFDLASHALERARADRAALSTGEAYADAIFGARAHILAGRFELAAEEARRAALEALRIPQTAPSGRRRDGRAEVLTCVADALLARQNPGAVASPIPDDDKGVALCGQLFADVGRGEVRCPPLGSSDELGWSLCLEARLAQHDEAFVKEQCTATGMADPKVLDHPSRLFGQIGALQELGPPAVMERLLERLAGRSGLCVARGQLAAAMAMFAAWSGEHREARRWAEQVVADFPHGSERGERAQLLRAAVELYAGDAAQARALLDSLPDTADDVRELRWMADVRQKGDLALLSAPQERLGTILHEPQRVEPWSLTSQGDGARLAAWLQRHDADGIGAYLLLGAPHLSRGREELLTWFRWGDKSECVSCTPALLLFDAASREEAVDMLGDRALAGELRAVAQAFHHALLTRDKAVPLAVIEAL